MKVKQLIFSTCAAFFFIATLWAQQDSTLYKVMQSPEFHLNKHVVIRGIVDQYIPISIPYSASETERTVAYVLKGDFGDRILVKSHLEIPVTNTKYEVTGMFQESREPFFDFEIIETKRIEIIVSNEKEVVTTESWWDKFGLYVLIGAALLILIALVLMMFRGRKSTSYIAAEPAGIYKSQPDFTTDNDFRTIKLAVNAPKTMRFIPGNLEISNGPDKGKTFKMVGFPTENGSIVTLGRDNVSGERAYSHIQLQDQTVSRKQAEIILKNGKLYLKNLSEVNYTQVNGMDVRPQEITELNDGSVIRTGAVEFKYTV